MMGEKTGIQWSDSTLNIASGCDGCELWVPRLGIRICYAGVDTERKTAKGLRKGWPPRFDQPTIFPERIVWLTKWKDLTGTPRPNKPWLDGLPRVIFQGDMGDYFTASLPLDWLAEFLPAITASPHRHLFLTKRPDRAQQFFARHPLPVNAWAGTSITGPQDPRLHALVKIDTDRLFVSYEPILVGAAETIRRFPQIRWWIIGGASGCEIATNIRDVRAAKQAARENRASVFIKQLGSYVIHDGISGPDEHWPRETGDFDEGGHFRKYLVDRKGGAMYEWPEDLRVREVPR
jgi:protein gp37